MSCINIVRLFENGPQTAGIRSVSPRGRTASSFEGILPDRHRRRHWTRRRELGRHPIECSSYHIHLRAWGGGLCNGCANCSPFWERSPATRFVDARRVITSVTQGNTRQPLVRCMCRYSHLVILSTHRGSIADGGVVSSRFQAFNQ